MIGGEQPHQPPGGEPRRHTPQQLIKQQGERAEQQQRKQAALERGIADAKPQDQRVQGRAHWIEAVEHAGERAALGKLERPTGPDLLRVGVVIRKENVRYLRTVAGEGKPQGGVPPRGGGGGGGERRVRWRCRRGGDRGTPDPRAAHEVEHQHRPRERGGEPAQSETPGVMSDRQPPGNQQETQCPRRRPPRAIRPRGVQRKPPPRCQRKQPAHQEVGAQPRRGAHGAHACGQPLTEHHAGPPRADAQLHRRQEPEDNPGRAPGG